MDGDPEMTDDRLSRTLEKLDADGLVSADPGLVRMLTGHFYDIETGPSVFSLPAIVVAPAHGDPVLVCSADEATASDTVVTYEGFTIAPIDRVAGAHRAVATALDRTAGNAAKWLIDPASVPIGALPELPNQRPVDRELAGLTAVKTEAEIAAIEVAIQVADAGQAAARDAAGNGATELDRWAHVRHAMESRAGGRIPILADFVAGARTAEVGGPPSTATIGPGDLLLVDLVPRVGGMWGDSCSTSVDASPTAEQRRLHAAACAALELGLGMLRPGTRAGDIDTAVRRALADEGWEYPHHTGHGVGFAWHEEPRVVPGSDTVLQEGMVVALEPGAYPADWGLRVEQVAVVTADGPRILSGHDLSLERAGGLRAADAG
jgi:Xaa-Pro dipeptidase